MDTYDRDRDHLNILGIVYYVKAGVTALFSLIGIVYALGALLLTSDFFPHPSHMEGAPDLKNIGWLIAAFCVGGTLFCLSMALADYLAGRWLRMQKHRTFCFVIAILSLLSFPYGTVLGIFTIIVLNRERVCKIFEGGGEPTPPDLPDAGNPPQP